MDVKDACEQAYQNGYYKGKAEAEEHAIREMFEIKAKQEAALKDFLYEKQAILKENHEIMVKLTAERDAAVADLKKVKGCETCKHTTEMNDALCIKCARSFGLKYEWRGLSLENNNKQEEKK